MHSALLSVLNSVSLLDNSVETWVVCLTDGISDDKDYDDFRRCLIQTAGNVHLVTIGINLHESYEHNLRTMCQKYNAVPGDRSDSKGFFVRADGTTAGMDSAFNVVKSKIPVSKTFELDGVMSDDECREYFNRFLPSFIDSSDMLSQSFWVKFLHRRTKVFDRNEAFNYNETHDLLESSLMEVMLAEVERLLSENQRRDWLLNNQAQLIYDFTTPDAPEFRLMCTAPNDLDLGLRQKLSTLDLPGFHIPTKSELETRSSLDRFLSQALEIPMVSNGDGSQSLRCIDEHGFILTIDFTMKLLSIHERVACRVPCLIEGETGVSKTALTKMYSILRNSAMIHKARVSTIDDLEHIENQFNIDGFGSDKNEISGTVLERFSQIIDDDASAQRLLDLLRERIESRSSVFVCEPESEKGETSLIQTSLHLLEFFDSCFLEQTFFEVNVDASLTEDHFIQVFLDIRTAASRLKGSEATIVVFLDGMYVALCWFQATSSLTHCFRVFPSEINTSSVLGLLKEAVIDHSLAGELLPENVVVVAACNPQREQIQTYTRERDLGKSWASGHYQVSKLPTSMEKLKWSFGSLTHSQEKDFIYRRIEALTDDKLPHYTRAYLTEVVATSHEIMREFAARNILAELRKNRNDSDDEEDASERARSIVSLRDIQRVFSLFSYFLDDMTLDDAYNDLNESQKFRRSLMLSIATVYYLRLDGSGRLEFFARLRVLPTEAGQHPGLLEVLNDAMDTVIAATEIPSGIAITRGLKENVFATLTCAISQTPLIIVGPPGSSKTLAVHIVGDNATGSDSISSYYKKRPRLSLFHYQCSKQSTSKEISAVFEQATQRQERVDPTKHRCVVFMDEAGLPEEEKESLKVLHYLLESHMSAKAKVGFVAISDHVLDAAKSNRCAMLMRQDPDDEEMLSIATGILFDFRVDGNACIHDVDLDKTLVQAGDFASRLCRSYSSLFEDDSPVSRLRSFFGLRDFVYFLKALRSRSKSASTRFYTSVKTIIFALERNFNGVTDGELRQVAACFLKPLAALSPQLNGFPDSWFRDPMIVIKEALKGGSSPTSHVFRPRFNY